MEELRSARRDPSPSPYGPGELVASGPRHGIKTSLCEVINSDRFLEFVGLLEDTALSRGAVSQRRSRSRARPSPDPLALQPGCLETRMVGQILWCWSDENRMTRSSLPPGHHHPTMIYPLCPNMTVHFTITITSPVCPSITTHTFYPSITMGNILKEKH